MAFQEWSPPKRRWIPFLLFSVCVSLSEVPGQSPPEPPIVEVEQGKLRGVSLDEELAVFRGVPYARPPEGERRWKAPVPPTGWEGIRQATEFSRVCPQDSLIATLSGEELPETSEDCLYLNVWTTALGSNEIGSQPVLVFIHGGGFVGGWGHQKLYDGATLARNGVVVVTLNYRLGPLGFFAHEDLSSESASGTSGNYGLLDQLRALKWIQTNIEAFGGDPDHVVIAGESAGGTSVACLCASPLAEGLFCGAIAQSVWISEINFTRLRETAHRVAGAEFQGGFYAELMGETLGGPSIEELRAANPDDLWKALGNRFEPTVVVDGWFLDDLAEDVFGAGEHLDVPMILGTTRDEGATFAPILPVSSKQDFLSALRGLYGSLAVELASHYPIKVAAEAPLQAAKVMGDRWFVRGTRAILRGLAASQTPAWQYEFARPSPLMPGLGAHHACELPYVFGVLEEAGYSEVDKALAEKVQGYWIQFVKTLNPNGPELPQWPAFGTDSEPYLILDEEIGIGTFLRRGPCDVLERIRDKMGGS